MAYEYVIVAEAAAGCVLANRLTENADTSVLLARGGPSDHPWDLFVQMPAAMVSRLVSLLRLRYESQPDPTYHGAASLPGQGKLLVGRRHHGMIFQRGKCDGLRAVGRRPRHGELDYAALPAVLQADGGGPECGCLAETITDRSCWSVVPSRIVVRPRSSRARSRKAATRYQRTPIGYRQEGFGAFDRRSVAAAGFNAARAYLNPIERRDNLDVRCGTFVTAPVRWAPRRRRRN